MDAYDKARFDDIKRVYDKFLPEWEEEYKRTGKMHYDPYVRDWLREFTPIEHTVWSDIRANGVPFYPQIPALGYYLDFACPMKKIAIECDGKEFHDAVKDAARDEALAQAGWTVFRLQGHECKRLIEDPWMIDPDEDFMYYEKLSQWFDQTSAGLVYSITQQWFTKQHTQWAEEHSGYISGSLWKHRTTPYIEIPSLRKSD